MKLQHANNVTSTFSGVETSQFSIDMNGKMFRILLDGLYTNKILAIMRELWSNAADSHVEAGMDSIPFDCHLPSALDPTFRVRDYGVSMTHEQIMGLYATVGRSTKDESNSVVGAFGLGSKSPFAYSDSFTVIARLHGEKRTYFASIGSDGIPTIALVSTVVSDEAQGIEVSVACKPADIHTFQREAKLLSVGFDPLPNVDGVEISPVTPVFVTDNGSCAVFGNDLGISSNVAVRQGWVIYPVENWEIRNIATKALSYKHTIVIDVPIGSVSVVASREALSMDDATIATVKTATEAAIGSLRDDVMRGADKCTSRLEAMHYWFGTGANLAFQFQAMYKGKNLHRSFKIEGTKKWPAPIGKRGQERGEAHVLDSWSYGDLAGMKIVTHYPQSKNKVARGMMRYRDLCSKHNGSVVLLINPTGAQLKRLCRLLGLGSDQVVWIGNLPDPGRPVRIGNGGAQKGKLTGVYCLNRADMAVDHIDPDEDFYMVEIDRISKDVKIHILNHFRSGLGVGACENLPVYAFTKTAMKRYKPEGRDLHKIMSDFRSDMRAFALDRAIDNLYAQSVCRAGFCNLVPVFPTITVELRDNYVRFWGYDFQTASHEAVQERMSVLHERYPLIFDRHNSDAVAWYVQARDAEQNRSNDL